MTDNLIESNSSAKPIVDTDLDASNIQWQLTALTAALGDLTLTIEDSLSVGRGSDNDVVLGSKEVSRNHALLSVLNDKLYIKDLDSSNGTFINDERVESNKSTLIKADDTLGFASFSFKAIASTADNSVFDTDNDADSIVETTNDSQLDTESTKVIGAEDIDGIDTTDSTSSTIDKIATPTISAPVETSETVETTTADENLANESAAVLSEHSMVETVIESQPDDVLSSSKQSSEPVVKETIIGEVLAASAGAAVASAAPLEENVTAPSITVNEQETIMSSNNESIEKITGESVVKDNAIAEQATHQSAAAEPMTETKLTHEQGGHQEAVVTPEHDKTTNTALQEEADPDVLRAKQAATAQFSGTANLGAGRDLGTSGNNAMDQAIDNPANAGVTDKKPSGGWFIWVFIAIIIIGIALWLFNMGGA